MCLSWRLASLERGYMKAYLSATQQPAPHWNSPGSEEQSSNDGMNELCIWKVVALQSTGVPFYSPYTVPFTTACEVKIESDSSSTFSNWQHNCLLDSRVCTTYVSSIWLQYGLIYWYIDKQPERLSRGLAFRKPFAWDTPWVHEFLCAKLCTSGGGIDVLKWTFPGESVSTQQVVLLHTFPMKVWC